MDAQGESPANAAMRPRFLCNTVSNADEVARWLLDLHGVDYREERHAPGLHVLPCNRAAGTNDGIANNPVYVGPDRIAHGKDGVFKYFLERELSPTLLPTKPEERDDALQLYQYFWHNLWRSAGRLVYSHLLPHRSYTIPLVTGGVPWYEKLLVRIAYPLFTLGIRKGLGLDDYNQAELLDRVRHIFAEVEERLADGRRYLTGSELSIADLFFCSNAAPLVLPPEFGGSIASSINELPASLRPIVEEFQARPAGAFILRVYREDRPSPGATTNRPRRGYDTQARV